MEHIYLKVMATLILLGGSSTVILILTDGLTSFRHELIERIVPKTACVALAGLVMLVVAALHKLWLVG